jgi:peptide/nickel transport system substrate-binding protein
MIPKNRLTAVFSMTAAAALLLAACGGAATPAAPTAAPAATEAPAPTEAPKPTEAPAPTEAPKPTEAPAATEAPKAAAGAKIEAPDCSYGGTMKSIEAVDEMTVKFTLCSPDPAFPFKVAGDSFGILDSESLASTAGDTVKISEAPVGTGPYKLKAWKRGESLTFEANADYWGEKAKTPNFVLRWSKESAQRLLELQSGNADGISNVGPDDFATIEGDSALKLVEVPAANIMYIGFNNTIAPFDDQKVRLAFAYGINREQIVKDYYPRGSSVATSFVPDSFAVGASPEVPWHAYDPEKAKALLKEAGKENLEVTISYRDVVRGYLPSPGVVAQEIQAQLKEIGVNVKIEVKESGAFLDSVTAGKEPFYLLGWGADYPDATNFLDYHFGPQNQQYGKSYDDIVALLKEAASTADLAKRKTAYDKVNQLLKDYVPMIPVAHGGSALAYKANAEGAHANPVSAVIFAAIKGEKDTLVFVQNAEPISMYCADESDGETFTACAQMFEGLLSFKIGSADVQPALAESYEANADLTEWTFKMRSGVKFHNGATLDAGDVVASFGAMWDAKNPNHKGRTGSYEYWTAYFGPFLNAPPKQ